MRIPMSIVFGAVAATLFASSTAFSAVVDCDEVAPANKRAGTAKERKCTSEACESKAAEQSLTGAAKTSFIKKCVQDTKKK